MDIMELHQALSALLDKLKRNRELVSLSELKTKYKIQKAIYSAL